jgi:thioredoxin reductase
MNIEHHEYVVLGAGPAGLQVSYFLRRGGHDVVVLERGEAPGTFFQRFPRHRRLISINKVHTGVADAETNLRWDWNSLLSDFKGPVFSEFSTDYFPSADAMLAYLAEFARQHELPIRYCTEITRIQRDSRFLLTTATGERITSDRLIVATGLTRENKPQIPGISLCETYGWHSTDPRVYEGKRVLIIGKGNSAFETGDHLVQSAAMIHLVSPRPLRMAWRTHFVGDLRACNNNLLDTYQLKLQNAVLDATVEQITRVGDEFKVNFRYSHADGELETLTYDHVICCAGFRFDTSIFAEGMLPELTTCGRFPLQTCEWESTNVPGLFFAGTLNQARDHKKYMSAFIHGFRYNAQALCRVLESRWHGTPWPVAARPRDLEGLAAWAINRMNATSALWQQPGFLCDVVKLSPGRDHAECLEGMPIAMAFEKVMPSERNCLAMTLEFGKSTSDDPFAAERVKRTDVRRAAQSQFLHPIIRHYDQGQLVFEHHVIEDLAAVWREPEHVDPLRDFLSGVLRQSILARETHP